MRASPSLACLRGSLPASTRPPWPPGGRRSDTHIVGLECSVSIRSQTGTPHPQQGGLLGIVVDEGDSPTLQVTADGATTYQWQICRNGSCNPLESPSAQVDWSNLIGATAASYTTPPVRGADSGVQYRAVASSPCSALQQLEEISDPILVTVRDDPGVGNGGPPTGSIVRPNGGEYWTLSDPANSVTNTVDIVWTMQDNVRVCSVDVRLLFSTDAGATYAPVPSPAGGILGQFDQGSACISPETTTSMQWDVPASHPGLKGALYKVEVTLTDFDSGFGTGGNTADIRSSRPFFIVEPNQSSIQTLILENTERMMLSPSSHPLTGMGISQQEKDDLDAEIDTLARHPDVEGAVIDLGAISSLDCLYDAFDEAVENGTTDPNVAANELLFGAALTAGCGPGIQAVVEDLTTRVFTNVKYILVVGDDRIVPMARLPDRTTLLPEACYPQPANPQSTACPIAVGPEFDLTETGTTVGKALAANLFLSDDPLAQSERVLPADLAIDLFLPDFGIGRLVETPAEITSAIAAFTSTGGDVNPASSTATHKVLVTGYDFLLDTGKRIRDRWKASLMDPGGPFSLEPVDAQLLTPTWGIAANDPLQRAGRMLEHIEGNDASTASGDPYLLMSLSGHASHYQLGVPGENEFDIQGLPTADPSNASNPSLENLMENVTGTVVYGVGCHSGLPVPGSDPTSVDNSLDLPQTMLGRGVLAFLGNTGYGWGFKSGTGLSEELVAIFTDELTSRGTITVGDLVVLTKLGYNQQHPTADSYNAKTLMQWTLFGFPMAEIATGAQAPPEAVPSARAVIDGRTDFGALQVSTPRTHSSKAGAATIVSAMAPPPFVTKLTLQFNLTAGNLYVKRDSSGDSVPLSLQGCPDTAGCYYTLNGLADRTGGDADVPLAADGPVRLEARRHQPARRAVAGRRVPGGGELGAAGRRAGLERGRRLQPRLDATHPHGSLLPDAPRSRRRVERLPTYRHRAEQRSLPRW